MKIQQVEELVGISKKNIRFYEEQGLLSPGRAENGYREYGREDVLRLKEIKLLRKLAVPIEDIRAVLKGQGSLETCLTRQLREFDRQRESLDAMEGMTRELLSRPGLTLEGLDAEECLERIERLEKEGQSFMDVSKRDVHRKKATGAVLGKTTLTLAIAMSATVTCSPVDMSMSSSREFGFSLISLARAIRWSVFFPIALTTITTLFPALTSRIALRAAARIFCVSATLVPPNF